MGNDYGAIEGDDIVWKNVIAKQVLYISKNENDSNEVALGSVSYLVKGNKYAYDKAVELFNEAVDLNNEARNLKGLQKAADHFLKNCFSVGIDYDNR